MARVAQTLVIDVGIFMPSCLVMDTDSQVPWVIELRTDGADRVNFHMFWIKKHRDWEKYCNVAGRKIIGNHLV